MPAQPDGDPAPADGTLPAGAGHASADRTWSAYVHVPFCAHRCGYCDFNTYTVGELGPSGRAQLTGYLDQVRAEIRLAAAVLDRAGVAPRPLHTVFFGGGTPTLLPPEHLAAILDALFETWPPAPGVEVSTEANPDSVDPAGLNTLAAAGFTRVSVGMQSAVPAVLRSLDRTHDPARIGPVLDWAHEAGLQASLDLIYGTPGESDDDWRTSLDAALAAGPDHISAYALTVEPGTALNARVRRGELPAPDDDDLARRYVIADEVLTAAGFHWYEVSNWARGADPGAGRARRCRHNLAYWSGQDWWGFGPGAHSHVGGVRWWNVKHPRSYAAALAVHRSPAAAREVLTREDRHLEEVMLGIRLVDGLPARLLGAGEAGVAADLAAEGLLASTDPLVLTRRGRLLADLVVRRLLA